MSRRTSLATLCSCALVVCGALAAPPTPATTPAAALTVGDFVVRFVEAIDPTAPSGLTFQQAKSYLASRGIALPPGLDFSARLTEGSAAVVLASAGVTSVSRNPGVPLGSGAANSLLWHLRTEPSHTGSRLDGEENPISAEAPGACCTGTSCAMETPGHCWSDGGIFRGLGTSCATDPCILAKGQCCVSRQDCLIETPQDCASLGGIFTGRDSCFPQGMACRNPQPVTPSVP